MSSTNEKTTFTLFIPFRNEIDGLKAIMPRIKKEWVDEILLLDGSSTDGSKEWLLANGYQVVDQKTKGVKAAFWEAFEIAKGDVIIPFSPDGNSIAEDVPKLVAKIREGYDMVIASRYYGGISSEDDDFMSRLANRFLTSLISFFTGMNYTDGIGMYKAFKKKHLYEMGLDKYKGEHTEVLLTCRGPRYGLKITEISSPEPPRIGLAGSRAHPGAFGKYKSGLLILKSILREGLFYWPNTKAQKESKGNERVR